MQGFPDLKASFKKPDASLRIWGCSHMPTLIREGVFAIRQIRENFPRDKFFIIAPLITVSETNFFSNGEENATLDHIKRLVAEFFAGKKYGRALESHDLRGVLN